MESYRYAILGARPAKPNVMKKMLLWSGKKQVIDMGRCGEWEHYNSDAVVRRAIDLTRCFIS